MMSKQQFADKDYRVFQKWNYCNITDSDAWKKIKDYFNHPAAKYLCNNDRNMLKKKKFGKKHIKVTKGSFGTPRVHLIVVQ